MQYREIYGIIISNEKNVDKFGGKEVQMATRQSRSEARKAAFTQVFQMDLHTGEEEFILEELLYEIPECADNIDYIKNVVNGVREHEEELTEMIKKHIRKGWSFDRLSKVSKSILKMAVYEMKYIDDVPVKAAINEAVELAKTYGDEKEYIFINGVLANIYKELGL